MQKNSARILALLLMMVAFIGQTMTFNSSIPCQSSANTQLSTLNESLKQNDPSALTIENNEDCCGFTCCDLDCSCYANSCASLIFFTFNARTLKALSLTDAIASPYEASIKLFINSPYRPPIFIT
ncbi:hypothetical protein SAMN05216262_1296 [Colwellia chukchiensis]|uniref:Uncharacterized protein n=1 Tax=Colwellia chukchiensis TaxID=641665 RepID=A0A1H7TTV4_9GAMM|nr:hypothetical protein [Colwellia chukchiensis]SEL88280.1 hypothetical protein SAMN05216262_1296 [Colwellia chukchiensis]